MSKISKGISAGGVVLILLVFIGGIYILTSPHTAVVSTSTTTTPASCPTSGLTQVVGQAGYDNPTNNNQFTQVATSAQLYLAGSQSPLYSITTSTSGASTFGNVNCGQQVFAVFGDDANYYMQATPVQTAQGATFVVSDTQMMPMATLSGITFFNGTTYGTSAKIPVASNGQTISGLTMRLQAGNGFYGDNEIEIVFAYDPINISSVTLAGPGVQSTTASLPSSVVIPSGYVTQAYTIPGLSWGNSTTLNIMVKTGTLSSNTLVDNPVYIYIKDSAPFMSNGQLMPNQFENPYTHASIGLSPISIPNAINIYS